MKMLGPLSSSLLFPSAALLLAVVAFLNRINAFSPALGASSMIISRPCANRSSSSSGAATATAFMALHMAEKEKQVESAFMPPPEEAASQNEESDDDDDEIPLDKVETLGRGAAKVKRGKRKGGGGAATASARPKSSLTPEEVFYEGPPAITETIAPTLSILTVIGIVPAAAAWARQAWVRYKITTRRIRVTSGIGGKDMAEIVYPDITEIRTAKRLFGDGDVVAFLRDGAKFEMRNVPDFDNTLEFILKQCSPDVVKKYRAQGEVTKG